MSATITEKYKLGEAYWRGLRRITYLRDGVWGPAGTVGGWLESEANLSQDGECCVLGEARMYGEARVCGEAQVHGEARVTDSALVCGSARVSGSAQVSDSAQVSGLAQVSDSAQVSGLAQVSGEAWVSGSAQVYGKAQVYGEARVFGEARVYDSARVSGGAQVYGPARVSRTPLVFQLDVGHVVTVTDSLVAIDCEQHSLAYWLEHYEEIGRKHEYPTTVVKKYAQLLRIIDVFRPGMIKKSRRRSTKHV